MKDYLTSNAGFYSHSRSKKEFWFEGLIKAHVWLDARHCGIYLHSALHCNWPIPNSHYGGEIQLVVGQGGISTFPFRQPLFCAPPSISLPFLLPVTFKSQLKVRLKRDKRRARRLSHRSGWWKHTHTHATQTHTFTKTRFCNNKYQHTPKIRWLTSR